MLSCVACKTCAFNAGPAQFLVVPIVAVLVVLDATHASTVPLLAGFLYSNRTSHDSPCRLHLVVSLCMSRADMPGNVFVAPVGEALLCNSSLLAWRLIDSDSTRLYNSERRVPI